MTSNYKTLEPVQDIKPAKVRYTGIDRVVNVDTPGKTILEISLDNQIPHIHECGGLGRCSTCRVRIHKGAKNLTPPTPVERANMAQRKWDPGIRLACQARVNGDVEVERLISTSAEIQKTQFELFPEGKTEEREVAILFCDLRDFTKISTQHFAFDMAYMLNRFYTVMGEPILVNNGIIYQYVGDEIVGIFGTGGGSKQKICMDAVRAAFGMSAAIESLNQHELSSIGTSLNVGIGIHFGKAFIGHLGHPQFKQFSVVGDPVNTASRIQGFTRASNTHMLISDTVAAAVPKHSLKMGKKFKPELKGLGDSLELFEILGFQKMDMQLELQTSLHYLLKEERSFATTFYKNLFQKDSSLRYLFRGDMADQEKLLTHMITGIVFSLSRPEFLSTGLEALGRNHLRYGVKMHHYRIAHESFLETIQSSLGVNESSPVIRAWDMALTLVIDGMQRGAN